MSKRVAFILGLALVLCVTWALILRNRLNTATTTLARRAAHKQEFCGRLPTVWSSSVRSRIHNLTSAANAGWRLPEPTMEEVRARFDAISTTIFYCLLSETRPVPDAQLPRVEIVEELSDAFLYAESYEDQLKLIERFEAELRKTQ